MRIRQALGFWRHRPAAAAWIIGTLGAGMAGVVMLTSLCVRVLSPRLPMTDENHIVRVGPLRADSPSGQFFSVDGHVDEYGAWQARAGPSLPTSTCPMRRADWLHAGSSDPA